MLIAMLLAIGIPTTVVVIYAIGKWMYGEKWYIILGPSSARGDPDLAVEIEDARIIKLNLK